MRIDPRWLLLVGVSSAAAGCGSRTALDDATPVCAPGQAACRGQCIDVTSDDANCGGCGIVCSAPSPSTAVCTAGRCLVTLVPDDDIASFAVGAKAVFWTTYGQGTVKKVPLGGGAATTFAAAPASATPFGIAVDAANVYWANYDLDGAIMKASVGGGAATVLAAGQVFPAMVAVYGTDVFWVTWANHGVDGAVLKIPVGGGSVTTLARSQNTPGDLLVDDESVYWTTSDPVGKVMAVPPGGGTPAALVAAHGVSGRLAIAADTLVYCTYDDSDTIGTVTKWPVGGSAPTVLATGHPVAIAADATSAYWTDYVNDDYTHGTVVKTPLAGGPDVVLVTGQNAPGGIAVDGTSVYWIDSNLQTNHGMSLMKLTPK